MERPSRFRHLGLLTLVGLAALYCGIRLWMSHSAAGLDLTLDSGLRVAVAGWDAEDTISGLAGWKLVEANGQTVESEAELWRLRPDRAFELLFEGPAGERRRLLWIFVRDFGGVEREIGHHPRSISLGLDRGDRIAAVEGAAVLSDSDLRDLVATLPKSRMHFDVERANAERYELVVQSFDIWTSAAIFSAGLGFAAIGLICFAWRPESRTARWFLYFCLSYAAFWWLRSIDFGAKSTIERQLFFFLRAFLPFVTVGLLLNFTPARRRPGWTRLLLGSTAAFGAALVLGAWISAPDQAAFGLFGPGLALIWFGFFLLLLPLSALAFGLVRRSRGATALEVQRARALRWGTLLGIVPLTAYFFVRTWSGDSMISGRLVIELAVLLFPLVLGYSIVRHNLFQVSEMLLQGTSYGMIALLLSALFAIAVATVVPLSQMVVPAEASGITFVLVALAAFAASPLHQRIRRRISSRWTDPVKEQSTLPHFELDSEPSALPRSFCGNLAQSLADQIGCSNVSILICHPPTGNWWLAAQSESPISGPTTAELERFLSRMLSDRREIARDEIDEDIGATHSDFAVVAGMDALKASYAFPLVIGHELWGVLTVGEKQTMSNYSETEVEWLKKLARECALGLYHAHLRSIHGPTEVTGPLVPPHPDRVAVYEVVRKIGEGAMSKVYLARAPDQPRVALKLIKERPLHDPVMLERFQREARILQKIEHPNVIRIIDTGLDRQLPFVVVEYFPHGTLRHLLNRRQLTVSEACRIAIDVARGLEAAQASGIIHRDVSPRNLFLRESGQAVVGDFGIAHLEEATVLTTHSQMLGTPGYVSPEACRGQGVTWAADQYSLGATLFEMLAGHRPFRATKVIEILAMHLNAPIPSLLEDRDDVPPALDGAVARMLAKNAEERFSTYAEIQAALEELV